MRYREILEAIDNNDDMFAPRFQFGNLSRPEALEKYNDLDNELYGYESYWHGDEPEFEEKERQIEHLKIYVRQKFGEAFYNHMVGAEQTRDNRSDVFSKKDPFSNRRHREDPRITKAGKLHKQDALGLRNDVKNRIGTHRTPVLPESDDDELFGNMPSAASLTQSIARAIVRSDKSARLITSPFMVGFALGKTPGGEPLLHYWKSIGKDKQDAMLDGINDAVYDLIANKVTEDDDDMFGSSTRLDSKVIAQDLELWLRRRQTGSRRPLAQFEVEFVEAVIAGFNRSFLHGIHVWSKYKLIYPAIRYDLRNYIKDGALGVDVADHDDTVNENAESDDDNDMFGTRPIPIHWNPELLADLLEQGQKVLMYRGIVSAPDILVSVFRTLKQQGDWMARRQSPPGAGYFSNGTFHLDPNKYMLLKVDDAHMLISNLDWKEYRGKNLSENDESDDELFGAGGEKMYVVTSPDDEVLGTFQDPSTAVAFAKKQIASYLEDGWGDLDTIKVYKQRLNNPDDGVTIAEFPITDDPIDESDESDDEMFGLSGSAAQRMIYKFGKQMLAKLEQAYNDPRIKAEYEKLTQGEEPDANRLFDLVCRSTSTPFGKAIVVDSILREYAGGFNGLNDFGTLIDSGEWQNDIVDMWDMFGNDPDVAQQDWFQKEIQTFMGDR